MSQTPTASAAPQDAAIFERAFAQDDELAGMSYAARRILAMSAALFYRDGAAATSVRDITRACGLSPGALYKHFASKDDVLEVLVRTGHARLERRVEDALADAGPAAADQLAAFVRAYVASHLERAEMAQLVRREYRHLSMPRYRQIVLRRRKLRQQLTDIIRSGQSAGEFRPIDTGPTAALGIAIMLLDMCSRTSEWYDRHRSDPPQVVAQRYVTAALRVAGVPG